MDVGFGEAGAGVCLYGCENVLRVVQEFPDGIGVGGVEGQGDHGLDLVQGNGDRAVIVSPGARLEGLVLRLAAVESQVVPGGLVRLPDGA